jgi:hypothetical protein
MHKYLPVLLALLLIPAAGLVLAEAPLRVEVDLADGSHLRGTPGITSVLLQTPYARLDLPLAQLGCLELGADRETVACRMQNGDKLSGVLTLAPFKLQTLFGPVTIGLEQLRALWVVCDGGTLSVKLRQGLVLYYPFDRDEGARVSDRSGKGVQARVQGAQWTPEGRLGGGYRFGGARQMLVTEAVPALGDRYSFAMWVKFDHFNNNYPMLLADSQAMVAWHGLGPAYAPGKRNRVGYYSGAAERDRSYEMYTDLLAPGQWALVVVVIDQARSAIYLNGKLSSTTQQQTPHPLGAIEFFAIGCYNIPEAGADQQFNGVLDEVMIWQRALSAQEVQALAGGQGE